MEAARPSVSCCWWLVVVVYLVVAVGCVGDLVVAVHVVDEQHSMTLLSWRLRDHLYHVIVVGWFLMWLLPLVVGCG